MSEEHHPSRKELDEVWSEIDTAQQHGKRTVNVTRAARWLKRAEKAHVQKAPDCVAARYCIVMARYELAKAQSSAKYYWLGYLAILIEFSYLALAVVWIINILSTGTPLAELPNIVVVQVPVYVLVWGFLGGVAWCLYSAAYWSNQGLFDVHFFPWYLANPWISAVLSGAMAMLIIGGLSAIGEFDPRSVQGIGVLSVTAFITGFSTHKFWKLLDRAVAKILNVNDSDSVAQEQTEKVAQKAGELPAQ